METGTLRSEAAVGGALRLSIVTQCSDAVCPDHVHQLDARKGALICLVGFEAQHGTDDALHRTMILLYNAGQVCHGIIQVRCWTMRLPSA
jgi:hypothetical protein